MQKNIKMQDKSRQLLVLDYLLQCLFVSHSTVIRISFNWQFDQGLTKPLLSSVLRFGLVAILEEKTMMKIVDCWSAHCYALADGKI